jgi:hypothetical protein
VERFDVTSVSQEDLEDLYRYVMGEQLVGVRPALGQGRPAPGEQGAAEVLTVLITSGSGLALAQAVSAWVRTRRKAVTLTWTRSEDGESVTFTADGPDADEQLRRLLASGPVPSRPVEPSAEEPPTTEDGSPRP